MTLTELPIRELIEARIRSNAFYSLYKEAQAAEEKWHSIINEAFVREFGLDDDAALEMVKRIKVVIDGGAK